MALPPPADVDNWTSIIAEAAETTMNANVSIYKPGTPGTFDPVTDSTTGGSPPTLIPGTTAYSPTTGEGGIPARIAAIRRPLDASSTVAWATKRDFLIQIPLAAVPGIIPKGYIIRVNVPGDDSALLEVAFTVTNAANGSHAAVRSIETITEFTSTPPVVP